MLRRYFISNITIMLVLNLLVKPIWIFFIDRNVQITVGHKEYGLYVALVGLSIIFNILLDLGITNYNNKILSADSTLIKSKLPNMIAAKTLLSVLYFLVVLGFAVLFQYSLRAIYLVFLLAVVQMLNSFLLFLRSNVSANHDFKADSLLSVLDKLLMILLCGILLFSPIFKADFVIEWFIYTQIISYATVILIAFIFIVTRYSGIYFKHFSFVEMMDVCKKSIPYAVLILLMSVYMRSDTLMLERLEGAGSTGLYYAAYRILDAANMIAFLFAGILLPLFSRMLAQRLNIEALVNTSVNIMISAALALVAFCVVYSMEIMSILYPDANRELSLVFILIISSFPAFCLMYIYCTLLTANGEIRLLIKIALFGSLFSIIANALLIHYFHALGAALTCFLVEWILGMIYIYFSVRKFQLKVNIFRVLKFVIVILLILSNLILHYAGISLLVALIPNLIVFILAVYSIKLWDWNIILSFFKQYRNIQ